MKRKPRITLNIDYEAIYEAIEATEDEIGRTLDEVELAAVVARLVRQQIIPQLNNPKMDYSEGEGS